MDKKANLMQLEAQLESALRQPGNLDKVAGIMLQPILRDLLHEGRIRQCFATYQLGLGEEAYFDGDVAVPAAALSMEGIPEQVEVKSDRVRVETSPIALKALVRWNESNFRKFDILNRTQERAKSSIQTQEDKKGFDLIDYSSTLYHTAVTSSGGKLNIESIADAMAKMKQGRVLPHKLVINPLRSKDLMMLATTASSGPLFLPETSEAIMKSGRVGSIWGLQVLEVPDGEGLVRRTGPATESISSVSLVSPTSAYVLAAPNYVGVMAIRTDLTIETQKSVDNFADLFGIWEDIGFLVRYSKGIVKINVTA